jgi:thioredoxin-related protein
MLLRRNKLTGLLMLFFYVATPVHAGTFDDWYSGADGYKRALKKSQSAQEPMALLFYTDWCPFCRRMNQELLADEKVQRYLRKLVAVRINPEDGKEEKLISDQHPVDGYPTFLIIPQVGGPATPITIFTGDRGNAQIISADNFIDTIRSIASAAAPAAPADPEPAAALPAAPAHPVTLFLKQGGTVRGDLIEETASAVVVGWPYGTATFQKDSIDRIEKAGPLGGSL